jgi:hypothetical protein
VYLDETRQEGRSGRRSDRKGKCVDLAFLARFGRFAHEGHQSVVKYHRGGGVRVHCTGDERFHNVRFVVRRMSPVTCSMFGIRLQPQCNSRCEHVTNNDRIHNHASPATRFLLSRGIPHLSHRIRASAEGRTADRVKGLRQRFEVGSRIFHSSTDSRLRSSEIIEGGATQIRGESDGR